VQYNQDLNDIWGWASPDGREHAIVGLRNGVSIVDVTDPDNPVELGIADGPSSTWRDMKTWDGYAYITNETGDGLLVIDLGNLPNPITQNDYYYWAPNIQGLGTLSSCHNIYIDEFGYAYLVGCNLNQGGMLYIDVFSNPGQPEYVGRGPAIYAHDIYVRDNKAYNSEIYEGHFAIYDVTNKGDDPTLLGTQQTPFTFTHNAWLTDDAKHIFTTDETANAPIGAYNIEDPANIIETDVYRPLGTLGDGVIPHNVHVWRDWVIISYYTDGCIIIDGSRPTNLIEVGNFDTFIPASTGFSGAWGAYPFLPSETILVTDIGNGLYVLTPNYVRACWLEGLITDAVSGLPLEGADIAINSTQLNMETSGSDGQYATGQAIAGTFEVTYSKPGYIPQTIELDLDNGVVTIQDVALEPLNSVVGQVLDATTGDPVPFARIFFDGDVDYDGSTDANGNFSLGGVNPGSYTVYAGKWGYKANFVAFTVAGSGTSSTNILIEEGWEDDFILDLGWEVTGDAATGIWERAEPIGTDYFGSFSNPEFDVDGDLGDQAYMTGNGGGQAGNDDVDNGITTLTSPPMDLTSFTNPKLQYSTWFFNEGGQVDPNDELTVKVSNGSTEVTLETISQSNGEWRPQSEFSLDGLITITDQMQIIFETSDFQGEGNIVEAAVDAFSVVEAQPGGGGSGVYPAISISNNEGCAPLTVEFSDPSDSTTTRLWTFDGGTPSTSTAQNPVVTYNTPGVYSAILEASTPNQDYMIDLTNAVIVLDVPSGGFSFDEDMTTITFNNSTSNATSFEWDFGDGNTSTDENPVHTYDFGGIYTVTLIATNDCGSKVISVNINVDGPLSSREVNEQGIFFTAFPNPFDEQIRIEYDLQVAESARLTAYNLLGQQIESFQLSAGQNTFTVGNNWSKGVYLIRIETDTRATQALRLVKQ